jgi:hypothetical protein
MSLEEYELDLKDCIELLNKSNRTNTQNLLKNEIEKLNKKIENEVKIYLLNIKKKLLEEKKEEKKEVKRYYSPISSYGFDQNETYFK